MDKDEFCLSDGRPLWLCQSEIREVYYYNKADFQSLNNDISNVNWDSVFSCNDPCLAWDSFKAILKDFCSLRFLRKLSDHNFNHPGMTLNENKAQKIKIKTES